MTVAGEIILLRAGVATAAALVGGLIGVSVKNIAHSTLCGLVSLAAGALLAVTVLHVFPEATFTIAESVGRGWSLPVATAGILLGLGLFYLVGKHVYYMCPACAATASECQQGYLRLGVLLIITLSLHATMDGLAIAAGYEHGNATLGALIMVAVSYHKVPEGLALVSVCRLAGWSRIRSLVITAVVEMTTALGALLGILLLRGASPLWLGLTLAFIGGSFLYTVGFATLKEMVEHESNSILVYAVMGALSMVVIQYALPFAHEHGHNNETRRGAAVQTLRSIRTAAPGFLRALR